MTIMKDYILVRGRNIPVEQDVIYSAESVVELFNDGFQLVSDEQFVEYKPNNQPQHKMKSAILNKAIWVEIIEEEGNLCLVRDKDVNEVWVHKNHLDAIEID